MSAIVVLVGRLGKDAALRTLEGGRRVYEFSVAADGRRHTNWFQCSIWAHGGQHWVDSVAQYLKKGRLVQITGELDPNNGFLDIIVDRLRFVGAKKREDSDSNGTSREPAPQAPAPSRENTSKQKRGRGTMNRKAEQ